MCLLWVVTETFPDQQRPHGLLAIGIGHVFAVPACGNPLCNRLD